MSDIRISRRDRVIATRILSPYAASIEKVSVFGSRATGLARPNSDIDLVLFGTIQEHEIDRLWTLFDDSGLSVSVDILAYSDDLYPPLKRHIDATARTLFTRADLLA